MLTRALGSAALALTLAVGPLAAQGAATGKEPESHGRTLSEWIADLKAPAPQTRNAAAYEISGMGPAAAAVPALIESLDDPIAAVRFPVTVALGEIGPAAEAAVPRLLKVMQEDINDEVAAGAKRAIRHIKPQALTAAQPADAD
jgi:HEAT repeat protein